MSKIVKISLTNFKAISDLTMDFHGCTALITGKNNSGKSSFLRGMIDRIRFIRPQVMVKNGEKEGKGELLLDTGEIFRWEFDIEKKDKLTYITNEGRKSVTKELGEQFFKQVFDIDKFLQSSPKQQAAQLQAIIGLDFTDIDKRYAEAYALRTERNREAELYRVKLEKMIRCERVDFVDLTGLKVKKDEERNRLNELYQKNKKHNEGLRTKWEQEKSHIDNEVAEFNGIQTKFRQKHNECFDALTILIRNGYQGMEAQDFVSNVAKQIQKDQHAKDLYPKEPTYIEEMPDKTELDKIDAQILAASETNAEAQKYKEYVDHVKATKDARGAADEANWVVINIEEERQKLIESANFPKGISITSEGILVDGLPLDKNQISTSKLYTSALRIASMNLGEVRTLYFDASFLDRNSLAEIQAWANENDLQLLIERPDWEGNEISYEIIETV